MHKTIGFVVGLLCLALWLTHASAHGALWESYMAAATAEYRQAVNYVGAEKLAAAVMAGEGFGVEGSRLAQSLLGSSHAGESGAVDPRLVSANTRFGFKLYTELLKQQDAGQNIFISPSSITMALAMTYNGADGRTREAMAKVLELKGLTLEEVNQANAQLRAVLETSDPKVQLTIANSLWGRQGIAFKPEFLKRNTEFYGAEVKALDFGDPRAPDVINAWVSRKTQSKIKKVVDKIKRDVILFLINAIYFKGRWAVEFDKTKTKNGTFTLLDGRQKQHPMMTQSGEYRYYQGKGFQAVSLPYGDERVSMYIFLPDRELSLEAFHKSLSAENWDAWMSRFRTQEGTITLPRFKLEYEKNLNDSLKALGLEVAFDQFGADFSGMCQIPPNVYISKVKHKTFIEVNEEGTEAAAVTSVEMPIVLKQFHFHMVVPSLPI